MQYLLKKKIISDVVNRHHLSQAGFASELGLTRSHWSKVLNRRLSASPRVRRALLDHPALSGLREEELWDIVPAHDQAA
ncbi:MAG: hypothetical protein EA397_17000 [Deltaproteobacteria bacterium]|nr:MAG: hypothetical protein EA397_17000 [Deltaproteobacteria bacterium]